MKVFLGREEVRETEIRSLEVDFDKGILRINGNAVTDRPAVVTFPGPEDRFPYQKLFNPELATGHKEECDRLTVAYEAAARTGKTVKYFLE